MPKGWPGRLIRGAGRAARPDKRLALWLEDAARVSNKGRLYHRWWRRSQRAPGLMQQGSQWADILTAIRRASGEEFTLVPPTVSARAMQLFPLQFAATLDADVHAVLVLDDVGWHTPKAPAIPDNITLVPLPPDHVPGRLYSPELNPVERVWLHLRERVLSLRFLDDTETITEACCAAWNALTAEPGRLRSLCHHPWIEKVSSETRQYQLLPFFGQTYG